MNVALCADQYVPNNVEKGTLVTPPWSTVDFPPPSNDTSSPNIAEILASHDDH